MEQFHTAVSFYNAVYSAAKAHGFSVDMFKPGRYALMLQLQREGYSPAQVAFRLR